MSPNDPTAAAARLDGLLRAASSLHISAVAIVPVGSSRYPDATDQVIYEKLYDSYAQRGWGLALLGLFLSTFRLIHILRRLECRCVVASTPSPFIPFQAMLASRILNVEYVLDVRDSWEMESLTHSGPLRNRFKKLLEKSCARSADSVWVVTATLMERLRTTYGAKGARFELVPNGADTSLFRPTEQEKVIDLLFLGSQARYRNVAGVLESLALVGRLRPHLRAVFVGEGYRPDDDRSSSASRYVEFLPSVSRTEAARIVAQARLGIVSFSSEDVFRGAIGAKTYEYMASGVPLACLGPSGHSELRRLVESGNLGFYATSPAEFAEQSSRILGDEELWRRLSRNCLVASLEHDRTAISKRALSSVLRRLSEG